MKKTIRKIEKIISLTIGFPFILIMAIGYWAHSEGSFKEAVKNLLD